MPNVRPFLIALSLGVLAGCAATRPHADTPAAPAAAAPVIAGPAANDNLNAVAWTQTAI